MRMAVPASLRRRRRVKTIKVRGRQAMNFKAAVRNGATAMMLDILAKVLAEISPATANADHDPLAVLTDTTHEQLDRLRLAWLGKMVELDSLVGVRCLACGWVDLSG